jgi:glycosyltransferase involved in cell wall biosynthesis
VLHDLVLGLDRARFTPIVIFRHENHVAESLRTKGVRVIILPPGTPFTFRRPWMNGLLAPVKKVMNLWRGGVRTAFTHARFLRRERIDLLNLNNSITRDHEWMVAARMAGVPCISHEMGINPAYSRADKALAARLDAVICVSHAVRESLRRGGADFPHVTVIHCVFDRSRYHLKESPGFLRERHGIPAGVPVVGVVGNVKPWKGQETIVRAMAILRQRHPGIRCVLAGGTSHADRAYLDRLDAIGAEHGMTGEVIFAGFQPNPIDYMRLMDVVAHTSVAPEPFGIVLLEAMLLGKPLVSTTTGGPAEVVNDGQSGLLVEPGRPELLADAITRLLSDPAWAAALGARGRERLEREFASERTIAQTVAVYERVLAKRRVGGGTELRTH